LADDTWTGDRTVKVKDKKIKEMVDVSDKECPRRECYWPRPDPGAFTQGVGYRTRYPGEKPKWLCGNREISGCPSKYSHVSNAAKQHDAEGK
jgi:hypothetical protein